MNPLNNQKELENEVGPTVRPLQGIDPAHRGAAAPITLGQENVSLVDTRNQTNDGEMIAVSLGAQINGNGPFVGELIDLVAKVSWGSGLAAFDAFIDITSGCTFSLPAKFLRIGCSYFGHAASLDASTKFILNGGAAYGTFHESGGNPRRTVIVGAMISNAIATVMVPDFATSMNIVATTGAFGAVVSPAVITFDMLPAPSGAPLASDVWNSQTSQKADAFTLPNAARVIAVKNTTGGALTSLSVIFNLSL